MYNAGNGRRYDHLKKVQDNTGRKIKELEFPVIWTDKREEMYTGGILALFNELILGRQQGFNGPTTISWTDFNNWVVAMGYVFTPWEIETLKMLDMVSVGTIQAQMKDTQ